MTDYLNTTLGAASGGSNSLLPTGIRNFEISSADIVENKYNGRSELTVTFNSEAGSGRERFMLEPWSTEQKAIEQFISMVTNNLGGLGIQTEGRTLREVLGALPQEKNQLIGSVVELKVEHKDRKPKPDGSHLKDDGTPWQDQRVYVNRVVKEAPAASNTAAADEGTFGPGSFVEDDDIAFV